MILITEKFEVVAQDDYFLSGECNFCGECCKNRKCVELRYETLDGKERFVCSIYSKRPVGCAIWPMKDDVLPESCGYHWEKM